MLFRPAARSDTAAIVALYRAYDVAVRGASDTDPEDVEDDFASPGMALDRDTRVVDDDGRVVGYAVVRSGVECDSVADPALASTEVAERLLDWLGTRSGTLTHYLPADDAAYAGLLSARGWTPERTFWRMRRELDGPLPEPAWPLGVAVRDFDRDRDAETAHAVITTAFREIGGQHERTFEEWCGFLLDTDRFDPELYLVAEHEGAVVGAALSQPMGEDYGFVRQLAVDPSQRGRGVALALLHECFRRHAARGYPATVLGVDAGNPTGALDLYEKAGMRVHEQFTRWNWPPTPGASLA